MHKHAEVSERLALGVYELELGVPLSRAMGYDSIFFVRRSTGGVSSQIDLQSVTGERDRNSKVAIITRPMSMTRCSHPIFFLEIVLWTTKAKKQSKRSQPFLSAYV